MAKSKISLMLDDMSVEQLERVIRKKGTMLRVCAQNKLAETGKYPKDDETLKKLVVSAWEDIHGSFEEAKANGAAEPAPSKKVPKVKEKSAKTKKPKKVAKTVGDETDEQPHTEDSYKGVIISLDNVASRLIMVEEAVVNLTKLVESSNIGAEALIDQAQKLEKFTERMMDIAGPELFLDLFEDDDEGDDTDDAGDEDEGEDGYE